ncbi:MAG: enoyl-CoA hydratase/isomerase family protein [Vulcanimicrobiaceae bacterium]
MEHILQQRIGAVGVITIDRRERFNSLDVETARDLRKASLEFARDDTVRTIVLRGANGVFCSGADLKYIYAGAEGDDLSYLQPEVTVAPEGFGEIFKQILEYLHSTISEIKRAAKPVIAAVDGMAAAGGFGLAMCCDLVFASERASFEWAYKRTGLTGAESSTFFLPRLLGLHRAMAMVLLNPRLDAREALEWGLINAVYPTEQFEAETMAIAQELAEGPTHAYGYAKGLINQAASVDRLDHHLDQELDTLARVADGSDFRAGIEAFFAKKTPQFGER